MPSTKIACADGNFYLHRVFFTQAASSKDVGSAIAHRFLGLVCKEAAESKANKLIVAFDGANVFRYKFMESYKSSRHKEEHVHNKDGMIADNSPYEYLAQVQLLLQEAGIPSVQLDKYEADDVLASVAAANANVVLLTGDKDMYQTLRPGITMYNGAYRSKGIPKPRLIKHEDVKAIFGVQPDQCIDYQTLTGDGIDDIPRLVTKAKALKGLALHGNLKSWLANDAEFAASMRSVKHELNLNRKMVRLVNDLNVEVPAIKWSTTSSLPTAYFKFKDICNPKSKGLF